MKRNRTITSIGLSIALAATAPAENADNGAASFTPENLALNNPNTLVERYETDREYKKSVFEFKAGQKLLSPWANLRNHLDKTYGFKPNISLTHLYQNASNTIGSENDASRVELVIDGTWTFLARSTDTSTTLGFEYLYRDRAGTDIPPVALFGQAGSLYPTSVAFAEIGPTLGQLWVKQKMGSQLEVRVGKFFPVATYDFFPLKNFRTDFVDGIHAANLVIPLPNRGLGAFALYRPQPKVYLRLGVHDANADAETSVFNSLFDAGELFTIFEAGFDPGLMERAPGRPPFGDVCTFRFGTKMSVRNLISMMRGGWHFPALNASVAISPSCAMATLMEAKMAPPQSSTQSMEASPSITYLGRLTTASAWASLGRVRPTGTSTIKWHSMLTIAYKSVHRWRSHRSFR